MRLIKEIAKEVLKIFLCIIWLLFYWAGYIFMSLPKIMITCIVIDTVCAVIMCLINDPDNKETRRKEMNDNERKYVIVCNQHSGNWPGILLFWGHRTQDSEERSFGGYTSDIDRCEFYSERDLKAKGYHFPKYHEGMTWEEFRDCDDIVIEHKILEKLGYKQIRVWYMP